MSTASILLVFFAKARYIVGVTYNVKKVDIIIPPKIVAPTASLDPSPAHGPMLPTIKGIMAIIVLKDVIIMGLNLREQASDIEFSMFFPKAIS